MLKFNKKVKLRLLGVALFAAVSLGISGCASSDDEADPVAVPDKAGTFTFADDIQPLFTTANAFVNGAGACTDCHDGLTATSAHEMDLSTYAGIIAGADGVSGTAVSLLGQYVGAGYGTNTAGDPATIAPDWGKSKFKGRLRNNRMPPGAWYADDESNRDTYEINAVGYWLKNGGTEALYDTKVSTLSIEGFATAATLQGDLTIGELFTTKGAFVKGVGSCDGCHSGIEGGDHEMDMTSYAGIMAGADSVSKAPGVSIMGQYDADGKNTVTDVATIAPDWGLSKLKGRLRNNRMPPGAFSTGETDRDTAQINLVGSWITAGAPETGTFGCLTGDKADCMGDAPDAAAAGTYGANDHLSGKLTYDFADDVLPLFTEKGAFVAGATACSSCHDGLTKTSAHEMDLGTYAGIIAGADGVTGTAVSLLGQYEGSVNKAADAATITPNWGKSKFKGRLRNNRMPPGVFTGADETDRDSVEINTIKAWMKGGGLEAGTATTIGYDTKLNTLKLTGSTVNLDGSTDISDYAAASHATDTKTMWTSASTTLKDADGTVGDLFKTAGAFHADGDACTDCHDGLTATSAHEMDLSTYAGIFAGADTVSASPGVSIMGQYDNADNTTYGTNTVATAATIAPDWDRSKIKERLRNNRMPPGAWDSSTETNRDTPEINLVGSWIEAGAPDTGTAFSCSTGKHCASGAK